MVNAGWFRYDDGECKNFSITCPEGYDNSGIDDTDDDFVWISTNVSERPYHTLIMYDMTKEEYDTNMNRTIESNATVKVFKDEKEDNTRIIETQTEVHNSLHADVVDVIVNDTTAYLAKDGYYYNVSIDHEDCSFDENEFDNDTGIIKDIYNSIKRK